MAEYINQTENCDLVCNGGATATGISGAPACELARHVAKPLRANVYSLCKYFIDWPQWRTFLFGRQVVTIPTTDVDYTAVYDLNNTGPTAMPEWRPCLYYKDPNPEEGPDGWGGTSLLLFRSTIV